MKAGFSDRLKQSLDNRQLSQRQFATIIGTTEQSICRYVNGIRIPNVDVLYRMCKALDVSADYLLGLSDEQRNNIGELKAELLEKIRKVLE